MSSDRSISSPSKSQARLSPCCVIACISKANSQGATSVLYACKLDKDGSISEGDPIRLFRPNGLYVWENDYINKEKIVVRAILKYRLVRNHYTYDGNTKRRMDLEKLQMDLAYDFNAFKGIGDACPGAIIGEQKGCYQPTPPQHLQIFLISIAAGIIKNERITLLTKSGERVNLKLNCREHLTMSTSPSRLQLKPLTEDDDVGDVAVIKFDTVPIHLRTTKYAQAVCEGLILKYKPKVISIHEEPVEIRNADGVFVPCPGVVMFDTGNNIATGISSKLLNTLKLDDRIDHAKRFRYTGAGRDANGNPNRGVCSRVCIELKIRRRMFTVFALVDVPVENVDLLIGMDVISKLNDGNFTLGK